MNSQRFEWFVVVDMMSWMVRTLLKCHQVIVHCCPQMDQIVNESHCFFTSFENLLFFMYINILDLGFVYRI